MAKIKAWTWRVTHPKSSLKYFFDDLRWKKNRLVAAYQRARYGWSKLDIHCGWDSSVGKALGEQLVYFADNAIAWPSSPEYPEFEDWSNALRKNGQALVDHANGIELPKEVSEWYANNHFKFEPIENSEFGTIVFPEESVRIRKLIEEHMVAETKQYEKATEALHWIADNFGSLWD